MNWVAGIASNILLASILALVAWLVGRRLKRPGLARVLWVLVLVKLLTPPLWTLPVGQASGRWVCLLGNCNCGQHALARTIMHDTLPWALLAVWSIGALATAAVAGHRWIAFRRLVSCARPAPKAWQALANRLCSELSLRPVEILLVPAKLPPLVFGGFGRSRLLVPAELIDRLSGSQRTALLLHELSHLRHGDHWVRILELVARIVFWWLPVGGLVGRQLRACEEACCDRAVVARLPHARRDYAQLLLDVLDFASPLPESIPQATAMSTATDLEGRLLAILDGDRPVRRGWSAGLLTFALALPMLPCGLQYDLEGPPAGSRHFTAVELDEVGCPTSTADRSANALSLSPNASCEAQLPMFSCPSRK